MKSKFDVVEPSRAAQFAGELQQSFEAEESFEDEENKEDDTNTNEKEESELSDPFGFVGAIRTFRKTQESEASIAEGSSAHLMFRSDADKHAAAALKSIKEAEAKVSATTEETANLVEIENMRDQMALALKAEFGASGFAISMEEALLMLAERVVDPHCSNEYLFGFVRGYRCGKDETKNKRELDLIKGVEKLNVHHAKHKDFSKELGRLIEELRKVTNYLKVAELRISEPVLSKQPMFVDVPSEKSKDMKSDNNEAKKRALTNVSEVITGMSKSLKTGREELKINITEDRLKILRVSLRELTHCLKGVDQEKAVSVVENLLGNYPEDTWKEAAADISSRCKLRGAIIKEVRRIAKSEQTGKSKMEE